VPYGKGAGQHPASSIQHPVSSISNRGRFDPGLTPVSRGGIVFTGTASSIKHPP
jgi:hypothetical protein